MAIIGLNTSYPSLPISAALDVVIGVETLLDEAERSDWWLLSRSLNPALFQIGPNLQRDLKPRAHQLCFINRLR